MVLSPSLCDLMIQNESEERKFGMKQNSMQNFVAITALSLYILCPFFESQSKRGKGRVMATTKNA